MSAEPTGACCIVLHTHLPYVHHPDFEDFLEEDWLFEAITETYLPLLFVVNDLRSDDIPVRLTCSLTPPLIHMLRTPDLMRKFERYLDQRIELAALEVKRQAGDTLRQESARHYELRFGQMKEFFRACDRDLVAAFGRFQELGCIEIIASAATHACLPMLLLDSSARAQIRLGVDLYRETFDIQPRGFWLPECAYRPGLDALLAEAGVEWVVFDSHGVKGALPTPPDGTFRPIRMPGGVAAFGRDSECSQQVWSSLVGYPGDPEYRELYRDIGFDADYRYIRPFLKPDGVRRNIGLKYHRITGDVPLHEKELYSPSAAKARAATHAGNFVFNRAEQIKHQSEAGVEWPVVTAPFDTELFGHWWYEGPWFLEEVFRQAQDIGDDMVFELCTPSEILDRAEAIPEATPSGSTWGRAGHLEVWLSDKNQWIWPHLHELELRMNELVESGRHTSAPERRVLAQMGRELLLAQSSDWPFILTMETATWYAEKRIRDHVHRFLALADALEGKGEEPPPLEAWESQDAIHPNLDPRVFRTWN